MRPEIVDVVLLVSMGLTAMDWLTGRMDWSPSLWLFQGPVPSPTGGGMSDVLLAALVAATVAAVGGAWRAHNTAIKEAEKRAYDRARLEAVAREAEAALDAKNDELKAVKAELAEYRTSQGGGR